MDRLNITVLSVARIEMGQNKNTILKNTSYLGLSTLISYGLLFFSTVFIARRLGPDNFGKVSVAQIISVYLCILTDGMKLFGVREIAKNRQNDVLSEIKTNFNNITLISILLLLSSIFLILLLSIDPDYKILLASTIGGSMVMASVFVDWIYQGHEKMSYVAIANFIKYMLYVSLVMVFLYFNANIKWIGIATLLASVLASLYLFLSLRKLNIKLAFTSNISTLLNGFEGIKAQFVLGMTSLRNQIFYAPVTFILGLQGLHANAGYFNAAFKISFFLGALGNVYMQSVFPRVCTYCNSSGDQLNDFINRSTRLLVFIFLPVGLGGTLLSGKILAAIFGPEYQASEEILKVLIWSILIMLMTYNFSSVLIGYNRQDLFIRIILTVSILNLLADVFLMKFLKGNGAAWISLASEAAVLITLALSCKKLFNVKVKWDVATPAAGSLLMYAVLSWLNIGNLFINIVLGICIYMVFIHFIAGISFRELLRVEQ
jgi:O-antigen/teichoic acid export membrane protein